MRLLSVLSILLLCVSTAGAVPKEPEPAKPLKLTVTPVKEPPTLDQVNRGEFKVEVTLENTGTDVVVVWPYISAEVLDAKSQPVETSMEIGRWGRIRSPSIIEAMTFATLKPGAKRTFRTDLSFYSLDGERIIGWKLQEPGDYTVVFHYHYDRATAKKKFGKGCTDLEKEDKPWNKAVEVDQKVELKLTVQK